jgi:aspartyl-tRNA(Asn)/glutamyl-tRNA(Gln) amidotransferase subunit A
VNIEQAGEALRRRKISCTELTSEALAKVRELNPKLNAFITVTADAAISRARALDEELARGQDRGPLHGIPIAHKDLILTKGVRTTSGSKLYENDIPNYSASVVERLDSAGTVTIGKLGLHELAYGVTSTNPLFGAVHNPHNPHHIPGGSSGGSGAAVASGMVFMATGTDTGGSIRIPASYCGTVGLKPTYGLVSRFGVRPLSLSLDHVGPLTRTVRDTQLVMDVIAGHDERDSSSSSRQDWSFERPLSGLTVGVPENFYFDRIDPEVESAVRTAAGACAIIGANVVAVRVPDIQALNMIARLILLVEASAVFENRLAERDQFGEDVLALLDQGRLVPGTDYVNAQRLRKVFVTEFQRLFQRIDVLLTPATPIVAPLIGQKTVDLGGQPMDTRLATTLFMRGINALGLPALSLPCGTSKSGLPIGAQLIGRPFEDGVLMGLGGALESALVS